jgi:exopolysaccharide biosynthesis polyprenyl glycosylphosphotransferase
VIAPEQSVGDGAAMAGALPAASEAPPRRRGWLVRRALLTADVVGLVTALLMVEALIGSSGSPDAIPLAWEFLLLVACLPVWAVAAKLWGLYDRDDERTDPSTVDDVVGVFHLVTVAVWLLAVAAWLTGVAAPDLAKLTLLWAIAIASVTVSRAVARTACRRSAGYVQRTLVVGTDRAAQTVARKCLRHPEYGVEVVGFVDTDAKQLLSDLRALPVLGSVSELPRIVAERGVERVVVGFPDEDEDNLYALVRQLQDMSVQVDLVPRLERLVGPGVGFHTVEGLALVGLSPSRLPRSSRLLKRSLDVVASSTALILAAPLFAAIAIGVKLSSSGPVLFRQQRIGKDMREFTMLKFRTMRCGADQEVHREYIRRSMDTDSAVAEGGIFKLERADAVTPFGRWLRRTSLDELPQLVNVVRGEMSLVGPRPCLSYELEGFAPAHFERFRVSPGLTGLWQVTARAHATFGEALDMDVAYVRNWSFGLDLWLLCRTPAKVLRARTA